MNRNDQKRGNNYQEKGSNKFLILYFRVIFLSFLLGGISYGQTMDQSSFTRTDWGIVRDAEARDYVFSEIVKNRKEGLYLLKAAKKSIINGDFTMAKFLLSKVSDNKTNLTPVRERYLATIDFVEGNYKRSLERLSDDKVFSKVNKKHICLLKSFNLIALDKVRELENEIPICLELIDDENRTAQIWLNQLFLIKDKNQNILSGKTLEGQRGFLDNPLYAESWMKMALLLNKEQIIIKYLPSLSSSLYRSKSIRELIGFAYFRLGEVKKALEFIEDIEGPNADNIRGTVNLMEDKLELAFGHFKLALNKKANSQNALLRAIPLAYDLGMWDDGIEMLNRVINADFDIKKKLALKVLLNLRKGDYKTARGDLNFIEMRYYNKLPQNLSFMDNYVALLEADKERIEKSSSYNCRYLDGLNCWISLQALHWDNIGYTIQREEKVLSFDFDPSALKDSQPVKQLEETVYINQKDIEELDSASIELTPDTFN